MVWDVLNKWVFWCVAARAHEATAGARLGGVSLLAAAAAAAAGIAAPVSSALACADPLIPSRDDAATADFLARQLYTHYCLPVRRRNPNPNPNPNPNSNPNPNYNSNPTCNSNPNPNQSHEDAARLAHELIAEGAYAAAEVARIVAESVERWRLRLRGGRIQLSDATLGVRSP